MQIYNLIKYSNNYPKTSGGLCQYHKDDPGCTVTNSESFNSRQE